MKAWILMLAAVGATGLLLADSADAHGRGYRAYPSVTLGYAYGYPYGYAYRPYRYYAPGAYVGIDLWPRARRVPSTAPGNVQVKQLYVYPAAGQSEQRLADDRYACHTWAADEAGFDPTLGAGDANRADAYARAMTACLEARNYVVR